MLLSVPVIAATAVRTTKRHHRQHRSKQHSYRRYSALTASAKALAYVYRRTFNNPVAAAAAVEVEKKGGGRNSERDSGECSEYWKTDEERETHRWTDPDAG